MSEEKSIPQIPFDEFLAKMPVLEKRYRLLETIAHAATACIHDDRPTGGEVTFQMGGHRRIRLADALKALKE